MYYLGSGDLTATAIDDVDESKSNQNNVGSSGDNREQDDVTLGVDNNEIDIDYAQEEEEGEGEKYFI